MDTILQLEGVTKNYPGFCLDHLSFSIPKGMIVGLIGENGAGKTTTINLILHATEKDSGNILVFGKDHLQFEKEIKQEIGVVQDVCNLPLMFTASDIETVMRRIYTNWDQMCYWELIQKFALPRKQPISTFSKGMKVKLNFAIALAHKSRLLILDEATSSLDPVMRDEVLDLLLDFVQDTEHGVLFSTHITSDLSKIADYIAFLHKGRLLFYKPKDALIYHYGLIHCGESLFRQIRQDNWLAWRKQAYEYQVLVADREAMAKKYRDCVIDPATLDDIMLLYIRGETT